MSVQSIDEIKIGSGRRKDMGNIEALRRSIDEIELLHPVVVNKDDVPVVVARRIEAFRAAGLCLGTCLRTLW